MKQLFVAVIAILVLAVSYSWLNQPESHPSNPITAGTIPPPPLMKPRNSKAVTNHQRSDLTEVAAEKQASEVPAGENVATETALSPMEESTSEPAPNPLAASPAYNVKPFTDILKWDQGTPLDLPMPVDQDPRFKCPAIMLSYGESPVTNVKVEHKAWGKNYDSAGCHTIAPDQSFADR